MEKAASEFKVECNSCTLHLVRLAYKRAFWFVLFREPLLLGMRILAKLHRIDAQSYPVSRSECRGCIRFMKSELKVKSPLFRLLNNMVNPLFNRLRDSLVTGAEKAAAKDFAKEMMASNKK